MIELMSNPIDCLLDFALIVTCCAVPVLLGLSAAAIHCAYDNAVLHRKKGKQNQIL